MVSHLVYGEDSRDDHLGLRGDKGGKDEAGAIAELQQLGDEESLEMLCPTRRCRHGDLGRGGEGRGRE